MAMRLPPLERRVDQAIGVDVEDGVDVLNLDREVVVENNRDDRDRQTKRGGNQRFGDPGRDDRETAGAHDRHRLERDQKADHGAEQPDEGGGCAGGGEHPDVALEFQTFLVAALVIEIDQMFTVERLRCGNQRVIYAFRRVRARLGCLKRLVELATAQLRNQGIRSPCGPGSDSPQCPEALKNDRQTYYGDEQQRVCRVVTLLYHR